MIPAGFDNIPGGVLPVKAVVDLQFYPITGLIVSKKYGFGLGVIREDADIVTLGAGGAIHVISDIFCVL